MQSLFIQVSVVAFSLLFVTESGYCHVSLTFPPARKYQLDFLNSFWTKPPCGMPKGNIKTSLIAGDPVNITWHLGYAHQGGYKLELLNSKEEKIMDLTPGEFVVNINTAQVHEVLIPGNLTCRDCTIRLLRQVPEFSPEFFFWSCADVDIVPLRSYRETCSGAGSYRNGYCECRRDYWGNRCQYKDECESDADCNIGGKCVYIDGSALPTKQCFCSPNHFGDKCSRVNPTSMPKSPAELDLSKHVPVPLSDRMTMFFKTKVGRREDQDEIEFVLIANGTSFVGLGWRPIGLGPGCKNWPFDPTANRVPVATLPRALPKRQVEKQPGDPGEADYADEPYVILHEYAAKDPFTPMDCMDIVIGTARGYGSRVRDSYSRGRHTPHPDTVWGGRDDLVGATGWELDGQTTIIFRRKAKSNDGPDHTITDEMIMIWSRGQQPGEIVSNPAFQLIKGEPRISDFYVPDELKYHGLGTQRGVLYINFTAARNEFL